MVFNDSIRYQSRRLMIDGVDAADIAREVGTPVYVYSLSRVRWNYRRLQGEFAPLEAKLHYSVKANGNLDILRALKRVGSGFDCVSGGEIYRVLAADGSAGDIVFAGVGKTRAEIAYAIEQGVGWINVENLPELETIQAAAQARGIASVRVALRLNPEVAAPTHPHISTGHGGAKFGLTAEVIARALDETGRYPRIDFAGLHIHIGSQLGDAQATLAALDKAMALAAPHPRIRTINIGGGLPVPYREGETLPDIDALVRALTPRLRGYEVLLEPGRAIVADAGVLVSEVLYVKEQAGRRFYILDAGMTELVRPALYGARHVIAPLQQGDGETIIADVAGPVCESTDVFARGRRLPRLRPGDKVALMTAGAYGMVMASNYNARPRPAEAVVEGDRWRVSRRREAWRELP